VRLPRALDHPMEKRRGQIIVVDEKGEVSGVRLRKPRTDEGTRPADLDAGNND